MFTPQSFFSFIIKIKDPYALKESIETSCEYLNGIPSLQSFTIHNIYLNIQIISIQIIQYIILHLLSMIPSISYGNLQLIHSPIETARLKYTHHVYQLVETYNDLRKNYDLTVSVSYRSDVYYSSLVNFTYLLIIINNTFDYVPHFTKLSNNWSQIKNKYILIVQTDIYLCVHVNVNGSYVAVYMLICLWWC